MTINNINKPSIAGQGLALFLKVETLICGGKLK
jgi:hypothetical protein